MSKISRSLNGDKVVWIARERRKVIARADSREQLDMLLENRAAALRIPLSVVEEDEVEVVEEKEESEDGPKPKGSSGQVRPRKSQKKSKKA